MDILRQCLFSNVYYQRRSRAAATSKMGRFVIIVTKHSILDVAEVLGLPLVIAFYSKIDLIMTVKKQLKKFSRDTFS